MKVPSNAKKYLLGLQTWQLKHLAINTGISTGTNKAATVDNILRIFPNDSPSLGQNDGKREVYKSVDMGVKNLAYCVLQPSSHGKSQKERGSSAAFKILDWKRLDVLNEAIRNDELSTDMNDENQLLADDKTASLFTPAGLAPIATRLAEKLVKHTSPSHILIERQRFRSGRGAAVQEWTLRVNTLEAMLWASIETMRVGSDDEKTFPETVEMSPSKIAAYWNSKIGAGGNGLLIAETTGGDIVPRERMKSVKNADEETKRGMEKSEKISLVRSWFQNGELDVVDHLRPLVDAFMTLSRAKKSDGDMVITKKDDLADCVVQGVTFGLWMRYRNALNQLLSKV